jgi:peptidoglycan/xylan/chitin deacetylase (PgdA/CDA1 family)
VRGLILLPVVLLTAGCAMMPVLSISMPTAGLKRAVAESDDFFVIVAKGGETSESLAATYLGDARKSWMVEDYMGARTFTAGQQIVIPKKPWNPSGVEPTGYQLVPILVYHNLGPQAKGRLVLAVDAFTEQMRYLKTHGYRVVTLAEFVEWLNLRRQLPKKTVVLTFDDGYRSFREYAYPVLKQHGFPATLFVYTDYVGTGKRALSWDDLKALAAEGFDIQAHSKTHSDLRRGEGETDAQYGKRMQAELADPPRLFQRLLGKPVPFLAYPYGRVDDSLVTRVKDQGYAAGFTVRRESNSAFVPLLQIRRSQIYSDMTLEQFSRNLNLFHLEDLR